MKKELLKTALTKMSDWIFFLILVIYQILFLFQGLDFADEGFYATFYQQIFNDPQSVSFNFMYWFSGILGGGFYYLFPELGLFGIRILGVLVITSTIATVYYLLKKHINILHLRIGLILLILFASNDPKEMFYDNLSAFLYILSATFLFYGLKENKLIKVFLSGAFISLNMFTRTPSIAGLILVFVIIYYGYIYKNSIKDQIKQVVNFFFGFVVLTISILLIMKLIGHFSLFVENLEIVFGMGTSNDSPNNISRILKLSITDYSKAFISGFLFLLFIIVPSSMSSSLSRLTKLNPKLLVNGLNIIVLAAFIYLILSQTITWKDVLWIFTGLSLFISLLVLTMSSNKDLKVLILLGCLILLFAPFGSAGGLMGMGRYSLWLIFPIIIDSIFNIRFIDSKLFFLANNQEYVIKVYIIESQLNTIKKYFFGLCVFICLYYAYYYPYFDKSDRSKMSYSIENKNVKGIFTTKERAQVINELLRESTKYVKKNDYVLAYDCIPMFHFLTETKPFMSNSWPGAYYPEAFRLELNKSLIKSKEIPVIILQKIRTLNNDWPNNSFSGFQKSAQDYLLDSIMNDFMKRNNYKKVWENKAFEIQIPTK